MDQELKKTESIETKQIHRFTFGCNHPYEGKCQPIYGTWLQAREKMFEIFGSKWCSQYSETEWEKNKEYAITTGYSVEEELPIIIV